MSVSWQGYRVWIKFIYVSQDLVILTTYNTIIVIIIIVVINNSFQQKSPPPLTRTHIFISLRVATPQSVGVTYFIKYSTRLHLTLHHKKDFHRTLQKRPHLSSFHLLQLVSLQCFNKPFHFPSLKSTPIHSTKKYHTKLPFFSYKSLLHTTPMSLSTLLHYKVFHSTKKPNIHLISILYNSFLTPPQFYPTLLHFAWQNSIVPL